MAEWYFRNNNNSQSGLISCPGCRNLVRTDQEFCPYCARRLGPEKGWRGWLERFLRQDAVATRTIVGAICVFFLLQFITDMTLPDEYRSQSSGGLFSFPNLSQFTYIRLGSNFHWFVAAYGQVWRFVMSCFLHFGIVHILFNGWAFWDLGRLAEKLWNAKTVFAVFILTGAFAAFSSFFWNVVVIGRPVNSAGASGAICGILGLLLGTYYKNRYHIGEFLGSQLIRWAVYIVIFGLVAGADNAAHIGGMIAGAALGYFLPPLSRSKNAARDEKVWTIAAIAAAVIFVASLVMAIIFYSRGWDYMLWELGR